MGTPVEPVTPGEDCLLCFEAGKTPKFAHLVFHNVQKCPLAERDMPNDREFILTQMIGSPCSWQFIDEIYALSLEVTADYTLLYCHFTELGSNFFGETIYTPCMKNFTNEIEESDCGLVWGWGGTARVWFLNDPIPDYLCENMGFSPSAGNLFDKTATIANMADYRIANKRDKTNCLIRVDTTLIPPS